MCYRTLSQALTEIWCSAATVVSYFTPLHSPKAAVTPRFVPYLCSKTINKYHIVENHMITLKGFTVMMTGVRKLRLNIVSPGICGPAFRPVCERRKSIQSTAPVQQQHVLFRCPLFGPASAQDFATFPHSTWTPCHACSAGASKNAAQGGAECSRRAEPQINCKAQALFAEPVGRETLAPWETLERPALAQVDDADHGPENRISGA